MKKINRFEAEDGSVFNTEKECENYEELCKKVDKIMLMFPVLPKDNSCEFANGGGYIQHERSVVEKAKEEITALGNKLFKISPPASFGWIGRYFDDSGKTCLYSAWGRLSNIDNKFREWGQGYFAINPDKGVQKPFTKK